MKTARFAINDYPTCFFRSKLPCLVERDEYDNTVRTWTSPEGVVLCRYKLSPGWAPGSSVSYQYLEVDTALAIKSAGIKIEPTLPSPSASDSERFDYWTLLSKFK
jgi:hypothetical protein